jgi:hypothetical protein
MARKRYGKPGDLLSLQRILWQAILDTKGLTDGEASADLVLKTSHALAQLAGAYQKVLFTTDIEARLTALEQRQALEERTMANGRH